MADFSNTNMNTGTDFEMRSINRSAVSFLVCFENSMTGKTEQLVKVCLP